MMTIRELTLDDYTGGLRKGYFTAAGPVSHLTGRVDVNHNTGRREELVIVGHAATVPYLAVNRSRNVVCIFKVGETLTHYLGLDGCQLSVMKMHTNEFEKEFTPWNKNTAIEYATRYTKDEAARQMIPISGSAYRVLRAILTGQSGSPADLPSPDLEKAMTEATTFRKPEGAVAQIHAFLDKNLEAVRGGTVSRKELIEKLEAKEFNHSTIVTQAGVWARTNAISFPRPTQAEATKAALAEEKKAAKKAAKKTATA